MHIKIHQYDTLVPADLLKSPDTYHFFDNTRVGITCQTVKDNKNHLRVRVRALDDAFEATGTTDTFYIDFGEIPVDQLEMEFERTFGRYPRAVDLLKTLKASEWRMDPTTKTYAGEFNRHRVLFSRTLISNNRIWSPFIRGVTGELPLLSAFPEAWNSSLLARALFNCQYEKIERNMNESREGGVPHLVTGSQCVTAAELSRALIEDHRCVWRISSQGRKVFADAVTAGGITRYEVTINLWL